MDGYSNFAFSTLSPEAKDRIRQMDQIRKAREEYALRKHEEIVAESKKIDASKITVDDLIALEDNPNYEEKQAVIWAVGRYFQHDVKDFTKEGKMDLFKKFVEICLSAPKDKQIFFNPEQYAYPHFLLTIENIKDSELAQVLETYPSSRYELFLKRPYAFSKELAQQVVQEYINYTWICPVSSEFSDVKKTYLQHFGDDFDQIHREIDGKNVCMIDAIKHKILDSPYLTLERIKKYSPEYILQLMPFLASNVKYETIVSALVSSEDKEHMLPLIQKECAKQLKKEQQMVDDFFKEHGNLSYVFLEMDTYAINFEVNYSTKRYPGLYELSQNPNYDSLVHVEYITNKPSKMFLLLNIKRIKEDKNKQVVIYTPDNLVGRLIGKGGENIKCLSETMGKRFKVIKASEKPNNIGNTPNDALKQAILSKNGHNL